MFCYELKVSRWRVLKLMHFIVSVGTLIKGWPVDMFICTK